MVSPMSSQQYYMIGRASIRLNPRIRSASQMDKLQVNTLIVVKIHHIDIPSILATNKKKVEILGSS